MVDNGVSPIFSPTNRAWLKVISGVEFITLPELAARIPAMPQIIDLAYILAIIQPHMSLIVEFLRNCSDRLTESPSLWWDEWKVNDRMRTRSRHFAAALHNAKDESERNSLIHADRKEYEERELFASRRLRITAQRLRVLEPALVREDLKTENENTDDWYTDDWIQTSQGRFYLSPKEFKKLRDDVREEMLRRREVRFPWVSWLTAITGLLGAATGLIADMAHELNT